VVIAGSDRATRRRGLRRQRDPSSSRIGSDLRQARERQGLTLEAVQDRTGVRRFDLEALEAGDLSRFTDEKTALIAVRRCAETLGLDAAAMTQAVAAEWHNVTTNRAPALVGAGRAPAPATTPGYAPTTGAVPAVGGHLSRYPGDTTHLRAFTQTAQVPQVARAVAPALPPGLRFDATDSIPVTRLPQREPDPAPLALRVAVWTVVLLLALAVAGMAVHHWRPAWLTKIHLVAAGPGSASTHRTPGTSSHPTAPAALVTTASTGPTAATVSVRATVYSVVVTTQAPCWIQATSPASFVPLFSATVPGGTTKTFTSTNGQLTVELGASRVVVTTQIFTKTVPGWSLTPSTTPYTITFQSAVT
jgi:cytoskeletal protein RodZ